MAHPVTEAIPASGTAPAATVRQKLAASGVWPVLTAGAVTGADLTGLDVIEVSLAGQSFVYDAADTTTAHDGVTCLVSSDGKRFKAGGLDWGDAICETRGLTAPPGSPTIGLKWLLPASPTGAWAAYGKNIAQWTAAGWRFSAPTQGRKAYVKDEDKHLFYDATAVWSEYPSRSLAPGTIPPLSLADPFALIRVEDARASPPGSLPGAGTAYIVAASPTGVFVGHVGEVARSNGVSYDFLVPGEGSVVWKKDAAKLYAYKSGAWVSAIVDPGVTQVFPKGRVTDAVSNGAIRNSVSQTITAKAGQKVKATVYYSSVAVGSSGTTVTYEIGVRVDTESAVREVMASLTQNVSTTVEYFQTFTSVVDVADASAHAYHITTRRSAGSASIDTKIFGVLFEVLQP